MSIKDAYSYIGNCKYTLHNEILEDNIIISYKSSELHFLNHYDY